MWREGIAPHHPSPHPRRHPVPTLPCRRHPRVLFRAKAITHLVLIYCDALSPRMSPKQFLACCGPLPPPLSHPHPPLLHFALRAPNAFSRGINIPAPSGENWDRGKETSLLTPRRFPSPAGRGLMRGDAVRRTAATLMGRIMRRITAERKRGM